MKHTPEQLREAANEHEKITRFLNAAHTGTANVVVSARSGGKGRAQELSVPRSVAQPIIDHAMEKAKKLEEQFGIEAWVKPKGEAGKTAK